MPRKKITLPEEERLLLCSLSGQALRDRARALFEAGWSLSAIGEALSPPRSRSTVQSWVSSSSSSSSESTIAAAENSRLAPSAPPAPPPLSASSAAATPAPSGGRRRRAAPIDPSAPMLSPDDRAEIASVAPLARQYRSGSPLTGHYAVANAWLTKICQDRYAEGVSIRELADAAGVTYKAMEKRVKSEDHR